MIKPKNYGWMGAILLFSLIGLSSPSEASWTMFLGNPAHSGESGATISVPLALSWKYATLRQIPGINPSSPITATEGPAAGLVFFAARDVIAAVDGVTGEARWFYPREGSIGAPKAASVRTTPLYANGVLYVGASDGRLYALDATQGVLLWQFLAEGAVNASPILVNNVLYFGADDGGIYAVNPTTGQAVRPGGPLYRANDAIVGTPAYGEGLLFFLSRDQNLTALDVDRILATPPDRQPRRPVKWQYHLTSPSPFSSPVFANGFVYIVDGPDLLCLTASRGRFRWRFSADRNITTTPAVTEDGIYFATRDGFLYGLTREGRLKWKKEIAGPGYSTPVVANLPSNGKGPLRKVVFNGSNRGFIYAHDAATGDLLWNYKVRRIETGATSAPQTLNVVATPLVMDNTLYVLADDGTLHCFRDDEEDRMPPLVSGEQPARGVEISGTPPIWITAVILDEGSGINPDTIKLSLDGKPLEYTYLEYQGLVYYRIGPSDVGSTPSGPKPGERPSATVVKPMEDGRHRVVLEVADWKGNKLVWEWSFVVDNRLPPSRPLRIPTGL